METDGYHHSAVWSGHSGNLNKIHPAQNGGIRMGPWMRQPCSTGILETKYKNEIAVELREGAIIQAEAAKELRQRSEGVRESSGNCNSSVREGMTGVG